MPIEDTGAGALTLEKTEHPRNSKWRYNIMVMKGEGKKESKRKKGDCLTAKLEIGWLKASWCSCF